MYLNGRAIEMTSILGPFFHVSALPDHTIFKSHPDVGQQLLCFSLFCQSAIKTTFIEAAIRKCGGNEEKGRLLYTAYGSTGQEDAQEPNPEGRVPLGESNCLADSHLFFGCQLAVLSAFLGPDQVATHALLASYPEVAPWVVNYQRNEEDLIEQTKTLKEPEYKALWTGFSSAT
ncbi:hypothetical protein ACFE04_025203 [Oxalis oulophora]